ncbi:hypothetical protein [Brevibacillus aydinogluensis]|jgi:hypothetical protein|uniref:NMD3 domain-containing protein n=1 Tax=Brevibacillus aydinogluensis TaxID=927786 RepID=A0AA48M955_9BACL|nr:hypothetical protein [Brevibacillus aydinogluensis]CAJ1002229.1 NMD3 domain-containing protein [Brevibacillus aydinogluensis]
MKINVYFTFQVYDLKIKFKVDQILHSLIQDFEIPEADIIRDDVFAQYKFEVAYDTELITAIVENLNAIYEKTKGRKLMSPTFRGFRYIYKYTDDEIKNAKLFNITSIGNKPQLYLSNKSKDEVASFCTRCLRNKKVNNNELAFNTSVMKKYPIVFVDEHLVISQELADKFSEWNLSGYELREVIHKGKTTGEKAFQIIPTNILPPQTVIEQLRNDPHIKQQTCPECGVVEHLQVPYCYDENISQFMHDFNFTYEYYPINNKTVIRDMLVSKKVITLLVEHGIAKLETLSDESKWTLVPVLTNNTV